MDLCTVTNKKYLKNVFNLVNSYKLNSYNKKVFIYCFDMSEKEVQELQQAYRSYYFNIVPKIVEYAYDPLTFFYKSFAISDCILKSESFVYSDATNVFNRFIEIEKYLIDDSLFLPYNDERLTNQYWTTKKCFEIMNCEHAKIMPQYWAGFQVYKSTEENKLFVKEMFDFMKNSEVALPNTTSKKPDGPNAKCVEHRQDQSVLSLLVHKHFRHQAYNLEKQQLFGDWQTFKVFNPSYQHDIKNCAVSARESKFGSFRFL